MSGLRISTGSAFQQGIDAISDQQQNLSDIQTQLSTGKRVNTAADDPIAAAQLLTLQQQQNSINQFQQNANNAQSALQYQETIFNNITQGIQYINAQLIQANMGTLSPQDRMSIATSLQQSLNMLVSNANEQYNESYLFSGCKPSTLPVVFNTTTNRYEYQGDEGVNAVQIANSFDVNINTNGKSLFFNIPSAGVESTSFAGQAIITGGSVYANSGSLTPVSVGDLIINNVPIIASVADGVSTTDANSSALSIATAINNTVVANSSNVTPLNISASAVTTFSLGTYTNASSLATGNLVINGQDMAGGPFATAADLVNQINSFTGTQDAPGTGVVASQSAGVISLKAADGRNIQLETNGTAGSAILTGFALNGGVALNKVQTGVVSITSFEPITVAGNYPANAGPSIVAGTSSVIANTGTGVMSAPIITGIAPEPYIPGIPNPNQTFTIRFDATGANYSIYTRDNPTTALSGYDNIPYTAGALINIASQGMAVTISGAPAGGDVFTIQNTPQVTQDLFNSLQSTINAIKLTDNVQYPFQLSYYIGVGLQNMEAALNNVLNFQSQGGLNLKLIDSQTITNNSLNLGITTSMSKLSDLDVAQAISQFMQQKTALEAAQKTYAKVQGLTLFNYI